MKRAATGVLVLALLVGCGSGSEAPTPTTSAPPTSTSAPAPLTPAPAESSSSAAPEPAAPVASIEEAIERTGCTGYAIDDQIAPFATEYGTCKWKGDRLQLYSFASEENREKFIELSLQYGATREQMVVCGLVVAAVDKQRSIKPLRELLGGESA